ncbi:MAG: hypothetical protein Q9167_003399, partial [Letrouitia subvulpina]
MLDYLSSLKHKTRHEEPEWEPELEQAEIEEPVLNDEDEAFLHRIATEGTPPPLPDRPPSLPPRLQDLPVAGELQGNNAQIALMDGAQNIPLPSAPETPVPEPAEAVESEEKPEGEEKAAKGKHKEGKKPFRWSFLRGDSRDGKRKAQAAAATDLMGVAEGLKSPDAQPNEDHNVSHPEAKQEEEEMTAIMEQLNLAAVNNRVFSISQESRDLLHKFTLVLKDLTNGVPTAYDDLESLLTNSESQLQRGYAKLPSFLQDLIKKLPSKMTQSVGPEFLAAAAEKHGMPQSKYVNQGAHAAEKMGVKFRVPSLKDLVTKPGAVAGMLKAIMNFLKMRFPAFLGMNVLYSLALFVLLFVFWYCHKRGRETRLAKERALTDAEAAALDEKLASVDTTPPNSADPTAPMDLDERVDTGAGDGGGDEDEEEEGTEKRKLLTTTAPEGASIEEVKAGMLVKVNEREEPAG